jgi:hypothetical protein
MFASQNKSNFLSNNNKKIVKTSLQSVCNIWQSLMKNKTPKLLVSNFNLFFIVNGASLKALTKFNIFASIFLHFKNKFSSQMAFFSILN